MVEKYHLIPKQANYKLYIILQLSFCAHTLHKFPDLIFTDMAIFTPEEDVALCRAWLVVTQEIFDVDPLAGGIPFWGRVLLKYAEFFCN